MNTVRIHVCTVNLQFYGDNGEIMAENLMLFIMKTGLAVLHKLR